MYEWEWELYFDMFAIFLAYDFVIYGQVKVLSFTQEAAWLRLMEAIYFPSILQKGSGFYWEKYGQDDAVCWFLYWITSTEAERKSSSVDSDYFVQANITVLSLTGRLVFRVFFDFVLLHIFRQTPLLSNTQVNATWTSYCRFWWGCEHDHTVIITKIKSSHESKVV